MESLKTKDEDRKIPGSRTKEKLWTQETSRRRFRTRMDEDGHFRNEEGNEGILLFINNGHALEVIQLETHGMLLSQINRHNFSPIRS